MITLKGKILIAMVVLLTVGVSCWRWWDKIAPSPQSGPAVTASSINEKLAQAASNTAQVVASTQEVFAKLLAGTNEVDLVAANTIPAISGVSAYDKATKNGKPLVRFPINIWPGWAPIIVANNGMAPSEDSIFYKKFGFYLELSIVDDPVKARDLYASGYTHILWGTVDMMALFAPALAKDSRTSLVIPMQIDFSNGGDGIVGRGDIRSLNDLRMKDGKKKKVVLAQNSPSHFFIMCMLIDANIDPQEIDFRWTVDAPSAAKLFVQDKTYDAFVGWSPDIYTVSDMVPNTRIIVSSASANRVIADVWAVRNDFYKDHPQTVANLVNGILEGIEMVRKDPSNSAVVVASAYGLPFSDVVAMIGTDGGIATGDAHLTNYRENHNFFLNPMNPNNFESIWNKASVIYQSLGVIDQPIPAGQVKEGKILLGLSEVWKSSTDLSQPIFDPNMVFKTLEEDDSKILTAPIMIRFKAGRWNVETNVFTTVVVNGSITNVVVEDYRENSDAIKKIVEVAGNFGNAYIVIEGNTDASMRGNVPSDAIKKLSLDRAESVKKTIMSIYPSFDPNKFKVVGNGWDNPLPNCTDPTNPDHNRRNRRTEIKVYPLEGAE